MNKDDIIRMAQDVGAARLHSTGNIIFGANALEHFVLLISAAEREACANVCDSYDVVEDVCSSDTAEGIAIAIRARGK